LSIAPALGAAARSAVDFVMADTPQLPQAKKSLLADFWDFIVHEKIWWMTPIIIVLVLMVAFILFAEASPVLPFIYAL